jgi:hypothetical protein
MVTRGSNPQWTATRVARRLLAGAASESVLRPGLVIHAKASWRRPKGKPCMNHAGFGLPFIRGGVKRQQFDEEVMVR